jgi:gliding motility-associated-like protein
MNWECENRARFLKTIVFFGLFALCFGVKASIVGTVVAYDDFARVFENDSVRMPVLNNDLGLETGVGTLTVKVVAEHGNATVLNDHTILYIPYDSYVGMDELSYEVCNVNGGCSTAKVLIEVEDVDFMPIAINDTVTYIHGTELEIDVLRNDTIKGDRPFEVFLLNNLKEGQAELTTELSVLTSFNRKFIGTDSIDYQLCDADGDCSLARIMIKVIHDGQVDFFIPNGISPNGDGLNDVFYIPDFSTYQNIEARVFDAWGQLVYQHSNYSNDWDGIANAGAQRGKKVPVGNYYYHFKIEGIEEQIRGYVYVSE